MLTVHLVVHYKIIKSCYYCLHPSGVGFNLLRGLDNIAQENTTADIFVEDLLLPLLDMVTVDQGVRSPQPKHKVQVICCGKNRQLKFVFQYLPLQPRGLGERIIFVAVCVCFIGSRNGVVADVYGVWYLLLWLVDLLTPVMLKKHFPRPTQFILNL